MYTGVGGGGGYSVVQTARYIQTECTVLFSLAQTNLSTVACEDNKEDIKLKKKGHHESRYTVHKGADILRLLPRPCRNYF